ncbi:MAG: hypothetical protein LBU53_07510 [Zoogloeaceae bacterium]|jgi:hypothetical protein|nr:hypothetical protein [Zoogloeaceae bacterium]
MDENQALFEQVLTAIFREEFPRWRGDLSRILRVGGKVINGESDRELKRLCRVFFEESGVRWLRYELHTAYWRERYPQDQEEDDDEEEGGSNCYTMTDLLVQRILLAYYAQKKRLKYEQEVDTFPYWRLSVIEDGRAYPECLEEAKAGYRHHADAYWKTKKLPCNRLDCRCSISHSMKPD